MLRLAQVEVHIARHTIVGGIDVRGRRSGNGVAPNPKLPPALCAHGLSPCIQGDGLIKIDKRPAPVMGRLMRRISRVRPRPVLFSFSFLFLRADCLCVAVLSWRASLAKLLGSAVPAATTAAVLAVLLLPELPRTQGLRSSPSTPRVTFDIEVGLVVRDVPDSEDRIAIAHVPLVPCLQRGVLHAAVESCHGVRVAPRGAPTQENRSRRPPLSLSLSRGEATPALSPLERRRGAGRSGSPAAPVPPSTANASRAVSCAKTEASDAERS